MIEINMLPGSTKRAARRGLPALGGGALSKLKLPALDKAMIYVGLAWVLAIAAVAYMHFTSTARLAQVQTDYAAAQRDSVLYEGQRVAGDSLRAQEAVISQKLQVIQQIDAGRFTWPHILDEVSRALPPYVWLVSMNEAASATGHPRVRIEGRAGNYFALGNYHQELEASPFLRQVRLVSSSSTTVDERSVVSFILEADYQDPPPDMIQTVPLFAATEGEN